MTDPVATPVPTSRLTSGLTAQARRPPRHRRPLTDDRRAQGVRTARITKLMVAAVFVAVFVCTPEVVTAMTKGFATIFAGQGIEDVAPARVPHPSAQPSAQP